MTASLGIFFALVALFAFGIGDIITKKVVPKLGPYFTYLYRGVFTTAFLFLYFFLFIKNFASLILSTSVFLVVLIMTLAGVAAYLAFCKGIQVGKVSIISPVSHAGVMLTVLLAVIFFKEILTIAQIIAVVLIIAGIIGVSFKYSDIKKLNIKQIAKGIPYAIIAALGWGIAFFLIKIPIMAAGPFIAALYLEALSIVYLLALLPFKKIKKPKAKLLPFIIILGALTAIGTTFQSFAIKFAGVALANPVVLAAPAVTIVLAYIFLKERLELNQLISALTICAGIVLAAL